MESFLLVLVCGGRRHPSLVSPDRDRPIPLGGLHHRLSFPAISCAVFRSPSSVGFVLSQSGWYAISGPFALMAILDMFLGPALLSDVSAHLTETGQWSDEECLLSTWADVQAEGPTSRKKSSTVQSSCLGE
ncbi:MAG: uncharacterized protein A8A55_2627 [Amphiamblys sp. WSBS2006]|nr:MAG: uncharacterized protein A8A55_2627 [Amphiamblys sp. WSBS2006]